MATEEEIRSYRNDWDGGQIHAPEGWEKNQHGTIAWVHFDTKLVLATVYVDQWFYRHISRNFDDAFEQVLIQELGGGNKGKGETKGKKNTDKGK